MRLKKFVVPVAALLLCTGVIALSSNNATATALLTNGSFESATPAVQPYSSSSAISRVDSTSYSGSYSERITSNKSSASTTGFIYNVPGSEPAGTKLTFSCYAKANNSNAYSATFQILENSTKTAQSTSPKLTGTYQKTTATYTSTVAGSQLAIAVFSSNLTSSNDGRIYVDSCSLDAVTPTTTTTSSSTTSTSTTSTTSTTLPTTTTSTSTSTTTSTSTSTTSSTTSTTTAPKPKYPAQVLDLKNWKITLPIDSSGRSTAPCTPLEVKQPALATASYDPWFKVSPAGNSVLFRSNVEGCTTSGSGFPRSELREMTNNGSTNAAWSTTSGTNTLNVREAVTHLPDVKPQVATAQIHNADDIVIVYADGNKKNTDGSIGLCYKYLSVIQSTCLENHYFLGTPYDLQIVASGGQIKISINGTLRATVADQSTGDYFKAGSYTQSNLSKGDVAGAYGEVAIYSISVTHS